MKEHSTNHVPPTSEPYDRIVHEYSADYLNLIDNSNLQNVIVMGAKCMSKRIEADQRIWDVTDTKPPIRRNIVTLHSGLLRGHLLTYSQLLTLVAGASAKLHDLNIPVLWRDYDDDSACDSEDEDVYLDYETVIAPMGAVIPPDYVEDDF